MASIRASIDSVFIQGFRSLADFRINLLPNLTVLIGANGSGKSNFIRFFEMLNWMLGPRRLAEFVDQYGGADDQLFAGSKRTPRMHASLTIQSKGEKHDYKFSLKHAHPDRLVFVEEAFRFNPRNLQESADWNFLDSCGLRESRIVEHGQSPAVGVAAQDMPSSDQISASIIVKLLSSCTVYRFHDVSDSSGLKNRWDLEDCNYLRSDGANLAAVLYRLQQNDIHRLERISGQIRRILPTFEGFQLEESHGKVLLRCKIKGIDKTIGVHLSSDGSLRFFTLMTLLNLPSDMLPDVLFLDTPEVGLHPVAIELIGAMIEVMSRNRQVILATQSPLLLDSFELDKIAVLESKDGRTKCTQLNREDYQVWLEDEFAPELRWPAYTPSQLWQMNLLGGRP